MRKYIIYAPPYDEDMGGVIVLYKLCSMLNEQGCEASIWPAWKPSVRNNHLFRDLFELCLWEFKWLIKKIVKMNGYSSPYSVTMSKSCDVKDGIVIYPEIIEGNPLAAKRVIRWLLNKPGKVSGKVDFGEDDVFFYYHSHFNDVVVNPNYDYHLNVIEINKKIYKQWNNDVRTGTCYMVRKGAGRLLNQHDEGAIKLDGMSHTQVAEVFNKCKYFVSYDLYTMYSRYAAMCGCIPIVIPEDGVTKDEWRPEISGRYGIAYGWDDISWAIESRDELMKFLEESEKRSIESVKSFIDKSQTYYGD